MFRENRNPGSPDDRCDFETDIGVDLNRNYAYKWAFNESGSSNVPCAEDFRGKSPFSEPETRNIRTFLSHNEGKIKIALNIHAWGNLLIQPFNYDTTTANLDLLQNYPSFA